MGNEQDADIVGGMQHLHGSARNEEPLVNRGVNGGGGEVLASGDGGKSGGLGAERRGSNSEVGTGEQLVRDL